MVNPRPTDRLTLSLGVREEVWKKWRGQTSPTGSVGYWLGHGSKLRRQVGNALRIPTYTDLYYRDPGNVGKADLLPETAWNYEAGLDWFANHGARVSAVWFRRQERNTIDWLKDDGSSVFEARNFQEIDLDGAEIQVRQQLRRGRRGVGQLHRGPRQLQAAGECDLAMRV